MPDTSAHMTQIGTHTWLERTGGALSPRERRHLLRPLAAAHLTQRNGPDRRRAAIESRPIRDGQPRSRTGSRLAAGERLGRLSRLDVDRDLLFAAAMLHDLGLTSPTPRVDFTMLGVRAGRDRTEQVGLPSPATDTLLTAITLHHSPGVTPACGPVAYLLSAGAALDVVGLRSWTLPLRTLDAVTSAYPRLGFKREFIAAFRAEAAHVPAGRAAFLRRYGAFDLAIRPAPFRD